MVGFETTLSNFQKFKSLPLAQRRAKIIKWAIGGAAGVGVVVGVTLALTFGSIAATVANAPVHEALAAGGMGLSDVFPADGCCGGDCDCTNFDCAGDCCAVC